MLSINVAFLIHYQRSLKHLKKAGALRIERKISQKKIYFLSLIYSCCMQDREPAITAIQCHFITKWSQGNISLATTNIPNIPWYESASQAWEDKRILFTADFAQQNITHIFVSSWLFLSPRGTHALQCLQKLAAISNFSKKLKHHGHSLLQSEVRISVKSTWSKIPHPTSQHYHSKITVLQYWKTIVTSLN